MEHSEPEDETQKTFLRRCTRMQQHTLTHNPLARFLMDAMSNAGCPVTSKLFSCRKCGPEVMAIGGFHPNVGIVLCQNRVHRQKKMDHLIIHELIHAYDLCVRNANFENCNHHACTEVRAANLSGDCNYLNEANRGYVFDVYKHHQECVKRRAWESVKENPNCTDKQARRAVERVFKYCYRDIRPWNEYPWTAKKDETKALSDEKENELREAAARPPSKVLAEMLGLAKSASSATSSSSLSSASPSSPSSSTTTISSSSSSSASNLSIESLLNSLPSFSTSNSETKSSSR